MATRAPEQEYRPTNQGVTRQRAPFEPCSGDEPYLFVCYAHRDETGVYAELLRLHHDGVRLWYDKGVPAGHDWPNVLARRVKSPQCHGALLFLSRQSILSEECYREVQFARRHQKRILVVVLDANWARADAYTSAATQHADGFEFIIEGLQRIEKHELELPEYQRQLASAIPGTVRRAPPASDPVGAAAPQWLQVAERPAPAGGDREREIVIDLFLGVRNSDRSGFEPLQASRRYDARSQFKVMFQAQTFAHVVLVIVTVDSGDDMIDLEISRPVMGVEDQRRGFRLWDTIPSGGAGVWKERTPELGAAAWWFGLFASNAPLSDDALRARACPRDFTGRQDDWFASAVMRTRSIVVPQVTCKAYNLIEHAAATTLEGREEVRWWTKVALG